MEKIYRKVSVKERLPKDTDVYYTNVGKVPFFKGEGKLSIDTDQEILWWLEEIELPSDEVIKVALERGLKISDYDIQEKAKNIWIEGAMWMRDFVLAVTPK